MNKDIRTELLTMKYKDKKKALEKELGCEFIRINPAKENVNIFVEIDEYKINIVKSTKKLTEESTN